MKNLIATIVFSLLLFTAPFLNAQTFSANIVKSAIEIEDGDLILKWNTQREINTCHFLIEQSNDRVHFSTIAKVNASGNSVFPRSYEFLIANHKNSASSYRILLVTMDGSPILSNLVAYPQNIADVNGKDIAQK